MESNLLAQLNNEKESRTMVTEMNAETTLVIKCKIIGPDRQNMWRDLKAGGTGFCFYSLVR